MKFDDLDLEILRNPVQSLQLITAIGAADIKFTSHLMESISDFLRLHLGDTCYVSHNERAIGLFREDLLVNTSLTGDETHFGFSIYIPPDISAWSLLEKKKIKGKSDVGISFSTYFIGEEDEQVVNKIVRTLDDILLPAGYKKKRQYGEIYYELKKSIYLSDGGLLEDLIKNNIGNYCDPILSALATFHRIPWDTLKAVTDGNIAAIRRDS